MPFQDRLRFAVVRVVALFVIVHTSLLALSDESLDVYAKWAEVMTHAFALPAVLIGKPMRQQIIVATVVSVVYHTLRNFTDVDYNSVQRLDHAMSTALIATVFLKYFAHITHVLGIIVLMAGMAAAFEFGNVLASAVTAAILVFIIAVPYFDKAAYNIMSLVISCLSLGGVAPKKQELEYTKETRFKLLVAFALQVLSVIFYYLGDNVQRLFHWSHCLWHTFAYVCLYVLVDVIQDNNKDSKAGMPVRPSRTAFAPVGATSKISTFYARHF